MKRAEHYFMISYKFLQNAFRSISVIYRDMSPEKSPSIFGFRNSLRRWKNSHYATLKPLKPWEESLIHLLRAEDIGKISQSLQFPTSRSTDMDQWAMLYRLRISELSKELQGRRLFPFFLSCRLWLQCPLHFLAAFWYAMFSIDFQKDSKILEGNWNIDLKIAFSVMSKFLRFCIFRFDPYCTKPELFTRYLRFRYCSGS